MKLKKSETPEAANTAAAPVAPGAAIADRFKLDVPAETAKSSGGGALATVSLVCTLLAMVMLGVTAWLMYMNWELIANV